MKLRHIIEKDKTTPVTALISDGNYTHVHFSDGQQVISAYTKKVVSASISSPLKEVRRGVEVDPTRVTTALPYVKLGYISYAISRNNLKNWASILVLCCSAILSFAQNTAPVAVNDTLKVCNDIPTYFSVIGNDTDSNGDRLKLSSFTPPASGDLVAASNTGQFRYDWSSALSSTVTFTYHVKDIRFGNIGALESNAATVYLESAAPYFYTGTYTTTNSRLTCRSENNAAATLNSTVHETNESYQYILLDGTKGAVTIAPASGGVVEFKIKQ